MRFVSWGEAQVWLDENAVFMRRVDTVGVYVEFWLMIRPNPERNTCVVNVCVVWHHGGGVELEFREVFNTGEERNEVLDPRVMEDSDFSENMKLLENMVNISCSDGNWNYDPHLHGMANGMLMAYAIMLDVGCELLNPPEKWKARSK